MGGGGPGKIGQEKDKAVYEMVMELLEGTKGIRDTTFAQGAEGFDTGNIQALSETIKQGMESSMSTASTDRELAKTFLAQKNLGRTPFGQSALSKIDLEGKQRTGLVQTDLINQILQRLAPALTGQSVETAIGGQSSLADAATRAGISSTNANGNSLAALFQGIGQLGAAGIQGFGPGPSNLAANANAANSVPIGPSPAGGNIAPAGY